MYLPIEGGGNVNNQFMIYYLQEHLEYLDEVVELEYDEWADDKEIDRDLRIQKKKEKILSLFSRKDFCKLILVDNHELVGFISLFPDDGVEEENLTPWYATMYVKKEYRNNGYSRILNDALLKEAHNRGYNVVYLKTTLENYYEKFGAIFIKKLRTNERLYKIEI